MTPTMKKIQSPQHKINLAQSWILIVFPVILLLIAGRVAQAHTSDHSHESLLVTPSRTPTATATATATRTREPTATPSNALSSSGEISVKISAGIIRLRTGPDFSFRWIEPLYYGDVVILLGRLSDNSWLYVKTAGGLEGWIKTTYLDLGGVNVDYQPITTPAPPPEATIKVSGSNLNLRAGPSLDFSKVQQLSYGEPLILLGRLHDKTWLYVKTAGGLQGWVRTSWVDLGYILLEYVDFPIETPPPTETSTPVVLTDVEGHWIDIDLSEQKLRAYDGTTLVASFLVSTGLDLYPTETGKYKIYVKMRYSDMHGNDYYLPDVPFTMYYSGDFSIHGTYWHHSFGQPMSHGCINMDTRDAEWLYNFASVGTLVNVHR